MLGEGSVVNHAVIEGKDESWAAVGELGVVKDAQFNGDTMAHDDIEVDGTLRILRTDLLITLKLVKGIVR